ncbi:hypothetical protein SO802_019795 [Lithocarpus litseifolius]|uniref:Peptidase A1 domain-containing protein n=1 Tax=Lithocarpus litseifolius TaxID=425828 RepID=A0AAW2CRP9_9ROSI
MNFADAINSTKQGIKELQPSVRKYDKFYATEVTIGTPSYNVLLLVDTGSDETWVQGDGCRECFDLIYENFKYKNSRTYSMVSCDHLLCNPRICIDNVCLYSNTYEDGDYSEGYLSFETFKFPMRENGDVTFENVIFGVGMENSEMPFMSDNNVIGGIFGLGSGPRSILRQLEEHTHLRFSYCLFDFTSGPETYTYLHFGDDAEIIGNDQAMVETTSLLPLEGGYYLEVLGITMNGDLLPINPRELQLREDSSGGFIIDSGTLVTYLVLNVYSIVRNEVFRYLEEAYDWNPMVNSGLPFDLCYNVQPTENQKFPSLGINFVGAHLELGSHRVFKSIIDNIYCMLIRPTSSEEGVNILGAVQQQDYRFLFDVGVGSMQFVPEKCQFN